MSASGRYGDTRVAAGIVGSADLRLGDRIAPVLEAHIAASPQRFRGIRHRAAWADRSVVPNQPADLPQHVLLDPGFRRGYAHLRKYGLSFEGWVYHTHITDLVDLARAFPDTPIIFNHLGGPIGVGSYAGRRDEVFAAWKPAVAELAKCPNVVAKVGGIQMVVNGYGWHERKRPPTSDELLDANAKWYRYTIEQFGPGGACSKAISRSIGSRARTAYLEPIQEADEGIFGRRAERHVPRQRHACLPAPASLIRDARPANRPGLSHARQSNAGTRPTTNQPSPDVNAHPGHEERVRVSLRLIGGQSVAYSWRSARVGSRRAARVAGIAAATRQAAMMMSRLTA